MIEMRPIGIVVSDPARGLPSLREVHVMLREETEVWPLEIIVAKVDNKRYAVLRILDIREHNPLGTAKRVDIEQRLFGEIRGAKQRDMPGVYRIAVTDVIDAYEMVDNKIVPLGPRILPLSGSPVFKADPNVLDIIMGFQRTSIKIGTLVGTNLPASIDADALLRHMIVVGTTGTGKSWFRGLLMERLYVLGVPQVIFDPMGDYLEACRQLEGVIVRPGVNYNPRLDILPTNVFAEMIGGAVPTPFQKVIAVTAFDEFKKQSKKALMPLPPHDLLEKARQVAHKMRARDDTLQNVLARLSEFITRVGIFGMGFTKNLSGASWERLINDRKLVVVDLRFMDDIQLQVAVAAILSELIQLREKRINGKAPIPPMIVSFDEAHRIIPADSKNVPAASIVKNLLRYGRHLGIGVIGITQFPNSVDPELIRLPALKVVFALDHSELGAIRGALRDLPADLKDLLPKLERGVAFVAGTADVARHTMLVRISGERATKHGGETPRLIFEQRR